MSLLSFAATLRLPARRLVQWTLRLCAGGVVLAASLCLLAWLTFHWGILPRLDDWRPRVEAAVGQRLGLAVQIGRIEARSSGWVPAFTLTDVVLRDARGREALRLPQVSAALSVPSLLSLRLRLAQLLIDGARLEVRRDAQGRWLVAGMDMAADGPAVDSSASADWLFEQGELVIRGGQLRWVDELRRAPPLALQDVQLVLRNHGRQHELRLDATPPADWGARFQVVVQARAPLLSAVGHGSDWRRWSGTLYADLPRADAAQLRQHVDLPVDLQQGRAALRAWLDWDQAKPQALTLDAQLQDVRLRLAPGLPPLDLSRASVRMVGQQQAQGGQLQLKDLRFATPDGLDWAPSNLALQWQWAAEAAPGPGLAASGSGPTAPAPAAAATATALPWPTAGGSLQADRLDLAPMAAMAERLPIGAPLRRLLDQLQPQGQVTGLKASWRGPLDAPSAYEVQAQVRGMAMASAAAPTADTIGRPGWRGADLALKANQAGGQATLKLANGSLDLPGVFAQPVVALRTLQAELQWRIERPAAAPTRQSSRAALASRPATPASAPLAPPTVVLQVRQLRFANDDAEGQLEAEWRTGPGTGFGQGGRLPGVLSLSGQLSRGRATAVARYLPLGISAGVRDWVRHAVTAGEVRDVGFKVKGDLWSFPFVNREEGEFRLTAQLQGVGLAPVPSVPASGSEPAWTSPWPAFSQVQGQLVFDRNAMQLNQLRGRLWGLELEGVQGGIRVLSPQALLELETQVRGPAADLLRYVTTTPVDGWTGHALAQASATGPVDLKLGLNLPLTHLADTVLRGELQLAGNDLRLGPEVPLLAQARGRVDFTHRGVQVQALRTQVLGGEAQIDGGSQADGAFRFAISGQATAEGLRRTAELPTLGHWAQRLQGQAAYKLQLGLVQGLPEILLTSNLQGMALQLPEPLAKPAEALRPFKLQTVLQPEPRGGPATRDQLRLELGPLQLALLRDLSGPEPRVLRSALAYASALPEPVAAGRAVLNLPPVDVDAWQALWAPGGPLAPALPAAGAAASAVAARGAAGRGSVPTPEDGVPLPQSIQLRSPELRAAGRRLTSVTLDLQRSNQGPDEHWQAQLRSDQAEGSVDYLVPRPGQPAGRLQARLERLSLPPHEADQVAGLLDQAPVNMPALDIDVKQFELRGRPLGQLTVQASNQPAPAGAGPSGSGTAWGLRSEWQLTRLALRQADARLEARGVWRPLRPGGPRHMALTLKLDADDAGKLLDRLGFGGAVQGAPGLMEGSLGWDGSPWSLDLPSLGGALRLQFGKGRFLKADAGAARLLGVLSLQALPRRLVLDFRDLFQEGFAFDQVQGDLQIARGLVQTRNLFMRGMQAAVFIEGQADIAQETQDLQAVVVPELNAASASLAYAAINPAAGLSALVGQWLLRDPLRQASARAFHISGSWDDPQVSRMDRKFTDPLPAEPPRPASGPGSVNSSASGPGSVNSSASGPGSVNSAASGPGAIGPPASGPSAASAPNPTPSARTSP